jgi:hypothetical protein
MPRFVRVCERREARAFAAQAVRGLGAGSRSIFREGTGAKVVQSEEVCNNCARSFAHLTLHVDGCQTKLSHFDAVACNTEQCPDLFRR